jgi:hypothetical protein
VIEKNKLYNEIDIWLAPTELEGLHIPPQEIMLTEGCVLGTNAGMSGTQDYLENNKTGSVSNNTFTNFLEKTHELIKNKELRIKLGIEGRKKIIELGNREDNMKKMLELFNEIINNT